MHLFVHFIFTTTTRRSCCGGRRAVRQLPIQFICATSHGSPVPPHFMPILGQVGIPYPYPYPSSCHLPMDENKLWICCCPASASVEFSSVLLDTIPTDSTRFFYFLCVFASLGFRFLFVNNNFLQYSSLSCRCICSISTPPSILWILAHTRCCTFCLRY